MKKYILILAVLVLVSSVWFFRNTEIILGVAPRVFTIKQAGTGTSTAPSITGQILVASGTQWMIGNFIQGSNITITTSTLGEITIASAGGEATTSINGVSGAVTFATGTTGSGLNITTSSQTVTFNLPNATSNVAGIVSTGNQTFGGVKNFNNDA